LQIRIIRLKLCSCCQISLGGIQFSDLWRV